MRIAYWAPNSCTSPTPEVRLIASFTLEATVGDIILREVFIVRTQSLQPAGSCCWISPRRSPVAVPGTAAWRAGVCSEPAPRRNIRICTRLERQRTGDVTSGITGGRHVHQIIDTVHVLFDNLSDGVLYRLGISARVGCCHATAGGAMVGYCATGSFKMASPPAIIRMMASTQRKQAVE